MNAQVDRAVEDAVFGGEENLAYVNAELVGDDTCHLVDQSPAVNASQSDSGIEEEHLVHVPLGIEYPVAESALQLVGYRTCPLVDFYLLLVIVLPSPAVFQMYIPRNIPSLPVGLVGGHGLA